MGSKWERVVEMSLKQAGAMPAHLAACPRGTLLISTANRWLAIGKLRRCILTGLLPNMTEHHVVFLQQLSLLLYL